MRIDSHQHFWQFDPARDSWITDAMSVLKRDFMPRELLPELIANGVDATIAVQADQSEQETDFLLGLAAQNRFIAGVVGWVDLRDPGVGRKLEHFANFEDLCGFRHIAQAEPDPDFLATQTFVRGVAQLQQYDFTYDLLVYPHQLPAAIELVNKLPGQRFVLDHIAKPALKTGEIDAWAANILRLAAAPGVFCKLSGIITEADWQHWPSMNFRPYLDVVFDAFGVGRLMFGSDWPVCLLAGSYHQVKALVEDYLRDRSISDREKIFGGNAALFYGLTAKAMDLHPHGSTTTR